MDARARGHAYHAEAHPGVGSSTISISPRFSADGNLGIGGPLTRWHNVTTMHTPAKTIAEITPMVAGSIF